MYRLLVILIVASAFQQVGLSFKDFTNCKSRQCLRKIEVASRKVLRVDWKPISVFPKEAKQFK